jgi:hypothetical protein
MRKLVLMALASSALFASTAQAQVTGSIGTNASPFLELSSAGLNGGTVASLSGGAVRTSDQPFADIPKGGVFGDDFLAAGPDNNGNATLTFNVPVSYLSFLWGSPDTYNVLTINSTVGPAQIFTAAMLGLPGDGNQNFSQYVQFASIGGSLITSAVFSNNPQNNAFETANFRVQQAVPEPATWAMMLMGFGAMGVSLRRRRRETNMLRAAV